MSDAIDKLHFNVAVAHIYEFANAFSSSMARTKSAPTPDYRFAAREAAEIPGEAVPPDDAAPRRGMLGRARPQDARATEPWPVHDPALLVDNTITLPVQINGKKRADVTWRATPSRRDRTAVLSLDAVQRALEAGRRRR